MTEPEPPAIVATLVHATFGLWFGFFRWMARTLLLMEKSARVRRRALRALATNPALFQRLLAVHVGELPLRKFVVPGALDLGWGILTA